MEDGNTPERDGQPNERPPGLGLSNREVQGHPGDPLTFLRKKDIRDKLSEAVYNYDSPTIEQFIAEQDLEKIWEPQMLKEFLAVLGYGGTGGLVKTVQKDLIKTISILVHIGWENWSKFETIFFPNGWEGPIHRKDPSKPYPHEVLKEKTFLGDGRAAREFFNVQHAYFPAVIEEGSNMIIPRTQPLPFIKSMQEDIADGGFGIVTKEVIAPHYFRPRSEFGLADTFPKEFVVARKRFPAKGPFRTESNNLAKLASGLSKHDRLVKHLAFITTDDKMDHGSPNEFNILLPMADTDLKKFLYGKVYEPQCSNLVHLLKEALGLVDALRWLHEDQLLGEKLQVCCHMDLKLDNILIYELNNADFPAGCWKISDFGISSMIERDNSHIHDAELFRRNTFRTSPAGRLARIVTGRDDVLTTVRRVPGAYSAPEARNGNLIGPPSDIWSFGCILVQILIRVAGGIGFLEEMDDRRASKEHGNDHFCQTTAGKAHLNPVVKEWLESSQLFDRTFKDRVLIGNCKKVIKQALKIDPNQRPSAGRLRRELLAVCEGRQIPEANASSSLVTPGLVSPTQPLSQLPPKTSDSTSHGCPQRKVLGNIQGRGPSQAETAPLMSSDLPSQPVARHRQPTQKSSSQGHQKALPTPPVDQPYSAGASNLVITGCLTTEAAPSGSTGTGPLPRDQSLHDLASSGQVSSQGRSDTHPEPASSTQANMQPRFADDDHSSRSIEIPRQHLALSRNESSGSRSTMQKFQTDLTQRHSIDYQDSPSSSHGFVDPSAPQSDFRQKQFANGKSAVLSSSFPAKIGDPTPVASSKSSRPGHSLFSMNVEKPRSQSLPLQQITTISDQAAHDSASTSQRNSLPPGQECSERRTSAQHSMSPILPQTAESVPTATPQVARHFPYGLKSSSTLPIQGRGMKGSQSSGESSVPYPSPPSSEFWPEDRINRSQWADIRRSSGQSSAPSVNVGVTNNHTFTNVSKKMIMTLVSSTAAKIVFIAPGCVDVSTLDTPHHRREIPAPAGSTWERGSLAGNFLALRGYSKLSKSYIFHLYKLNTTLELECVKIEPPRLPSFEKFEISRTGRLLIGGAGRVHLSSSLREEPSELEAGLKEGYNLQRVWFSTSGLIAFALSTRPGNHLLHFIHICISS
ncbi:kinase-like protein [Acephala macrosclerotiorum]|nr:kinase-like protein [Acephala macrosclerotiorum]